MKTIRTVFLAGKITGNDWRRHLVRADLDLHPSEEDDCLIAQVCRGEPLSFPVAERGVLCMLDYVGPYHVRPREHVCDCDGSDHNHGAWHYEMKAAIVAANERALDAADVVFAWIDDGSAVGTAYELGYAHARGKEVWIAGPRYIPEFGLLYESGMCDIYEGGDDDDADGPGGLDTDPRSAFLRLLTARLHNPHKRATLEPALLSPIEERFLRAWNKAGGQRHYPEPYLGLVPQYPLDGGRYRLDFAHVDDGARVAIELDGLQAHSSTEQIAYDRRRQREIEAMGWRVVRFGGREVVRDVDACVAEARLIVIQSRDEAYERLCRSSAPPHSALPSGPGPGGPILEEVVAACVPVVVCGQDQAAPKTDAHVQDAPAPGEWVAL